MKARLGLPGFLMDQNKDFKVQKMTTIVDRTCLLRYWPVIDEYIEDNQVSDRLHQKLSQALAESREGSPRPEEF